MERPALEHRIKDMQARSKIRNKKNNPKYSAKRPSTKKLRGELEWLPKQGAKRKALEQLIKNLQAKNKKANQKANKAAYNKAKKKRRRTE